MRRKNKTAIAVCAAIISTLTFGGYGALIASADIIIPDPLPIPLPIPGAPNVHPNFVHNELMIGESLEVAKEVTTPDIPPVIDICLLQDETGSFYDDIAKLQDGTTAEDIYNAITAVSPDAHFAVTGFGDHPVIPYGWPNPPNGPDHVYHRLSGMSGALGDWLNGINLLQAKGGRDIPEAQFDAIVAAAGPGIYVDPTHGEQFDCGWRDKAAAPGVQRILVVTTDAPFHAPGAGKPHVHDEAAVIAALNAQEITVVGLKAPGAGLELNNLALATGGSVQPLSSDGSDIAQAILTGLKEVTTDVWFETHCDAGLNVSLSPSVHYDVPGGSLVNFVETISVNNDPLLQGTSLFCKVTFIANSYPETGAPIGTQRIRIDVPDTTAPKAVCVETVNPHGKNTPKAGQKSPGQNEDGFYELLAKDNVDEAPEIFVTDMETGIVFGPFETGTKIKYSEANGADPSQKKMGSENGKAGAVAWHLKGQGDAGVFATDMSGNISDVASCLVPPLPK